MVYFDTPYNWLPYGDCGTERGNVFAANLGPQKKMAESSYLALQCTSFTTNCLYNL
jgi:hypothetical protein